MGADTQPPTYWLPNPRLALVQWASEQVTLRANLGRYGRLPSISERYGNTGQVLGNPNLVPESGTNADVGANWTRKGERLRLALDGALFAAWSAQPDLFPTAWQLHAAGQPGSRRASWAWKFRPPSIGEAVFDSSGRPPSPMPATLKT